MSFFRREVIDFALDYETRKLAREQLEWIAREPENARPYYQLALIYRMQYEQERALGLLLEAVRLDPGMAEAHLALTEIYAVRGEETAAWRHARLAEANGKKEGVALLQRYQVPEG
jgi:Tfp pilus assembly protein PilF